MRLGTREGLCGPPSGRRAAAVHIASRLLVLLVTKRVKWKDMFVLLSLHRETPVGGYTKGK